eukprot:TRINITY_DN2130_c0_g1_i1.p1 TRINITY_DN2130_c0_g1~~TRINITY_DN2130_c0_g1_i1.p1  ORF type:complete len:423 (+),score=67.05 TRINITY_DN2130_c0_g1_i1:89-1357(+)
MQLRAILSFWGFALAACSESPWSQDLRRARQVVPRADWRGSGSLASANARLNQHLAARVGLRLRVCEEYTVAELRETLRMLHGWSSEELKRVYAETDGRAAQYTDVAAMEAHWASHAPSGDERVRDAHCHEAVMWFVHHLTSDAQKNAMSLIVLPTLPLRDHVSTVQLRGGDDKAAAFYAEKTTCQKCHVGGGSEAVAQPRVVSDGDTPPKWAPRFHIDYTEYTSMMKPFPWQKGTVNNGSLHYDVEKMRQVWIHGKGQSDNWCMCSGVDTDESCSLVAAPSSSEDGGGATYVIFKSIGKCCKLGTFAKGFGPIAQDWLSDATKLGDEAVGEQTCTTWSGGPPGDWFMMVSDDWSVDAQGRPCKYADHFKTWAKILLGMQHYYTFDLESYSEAAELDDVFVVPEGMGCEEECPNKQGWCKTK